MRPWRAFSAAAIASMLPTIDVTKIYVMLPVMTDQLGLGAVGSQLAVTGYLLVFALAVVPAGRVGDRHSRRAVLAVGLGIFGAASVVVGLAPDPTVLVAGRLIQGLGAALVLPQTIGFIQQLFTGQDRARAFSIFGALLGAAAVGAPLLGGGLIAALGDEWGWRISFLINVPIALVIIILARRLPRSSSETAPPSTSRGAVRTILSLRSYRTVLAAVAFYFVTVPATIYLISVFVQTGMGRSPLEAGAITATAAAGFAVGAVFAGRHIINRGRRLAAAGLATLVISLVTLAALAWASLAVAPSSWSAVAILFGFGAAMFVFGIGSGLFEPTSHYLLVREVMVVNASLAGSIQQFAQRVATTVGVGIAGAVFAHALLLPPPAAREASLVAFVTGIAITTAAAAIALLILSRRSAEPAPSGASTAAVPAESVGKE